MTTGLAPYVTTGDIITFNGTDYYVTKRARVNLQAKRLPDGASMVIPIRLGYSLNDRPLTDAEKTTLGLNVPYAAKAAEREDRFYGLVAGTVVQVTRPVNNKKWTYHPEQLFVVMKHNYDLVNIARLGGDGDRYWRMTPESLEIQKEYS